MSQGFTKGTPIDTDPTLSLDSDIVAGGQLKSGLNSNSNLITTLKKARPFFKLKIIFFTYKTV